MELYRQELPFLSPGDLSDAGIQPGSPEFQEDSSPPEPPRKPSYLTIHLKINGHITFFVLIYINCKK